MHSPIPAKKFQGFPIHDWSAESEHPPPREIIFEEFQPASQFQQIT